MKAVWKVVPISDIDFGDRVRENYGDIDSLIASIKKDGEQLQALVVKKNPEGSEKPYTLICGGRRYMALKQLGWDAKVEIWPEEITEYQLRSMELRENLDRLNMDWREVIRAKERLHKLEIEQDPEHTIADTATLIGESRTLVSQDIELAKAIEDKPDLFKDAKSKSDAKKILARTKEKLLKKAILKKMNAIKTSEEELLNAICDAYRIGDAFEEVKKFEFETVDFVDCDPPYGIDLFSTQTASIDFEDDIEDYEAYITPLLKDLYKVLKKDSWMTFWFSLPRYPEVVSALKKAKFSFDPIPLLWIKEDKAGHMRHPQKRFKKPYETCLLVAKGNPVLNKEAPDGIFIDRVINRSHPTEKPRKTLTKIFKELVHPGDICLVPFAGSGNSIQVLFELGAKPVGFDQVEAYKVNFIDRVKGTIDASPGKISFTDNQLP